MYIIEVVCTGNNGRSPMAEVIGNHAAKNFGLEDRLRFISSGTRAAPEHDEILPYDKVSSLLNRASSHGLMKPFEVDEERYKNDSNYKATIQDSVYMARRIMRPIEAALRDAALYDINMKYNGKRTQTIARDDVFLALGMQKKHVDHLNEIYFMHKNKPKITTITAYAGAEGEISDCIGNIDPVVYFKIRDKLCEIIPLVIIRFKEDYQLGK